MVAFFVAKSFPVGLKNGRTSRPNGISYRGQRFESALETCSAEVLKGVHAADSREIRAQPSRRTRRLGGIQLFGKFPQFILSQTALRDEVPFDASDLCPIFMFEQKHSPIDLRPL